MNIHELYNLANKEEIDYLSLTSYLSNYAQPRKKIQTWLRNKDLIRVKKGLYVFGPKVARQPYSLEILSNLIYGPSAISLEYALGYYGLIPERVNVITSITPNRDKSFATPVGRFEYKYLNVEKYFMGITQTKVRDGRHILIASKEKALSDKLTIKSDKMKNINELQTYLIEDLRIDENVLYTINIKDIKLINQIYRHSNLTLLIKLLEG